MVYRKPASKTKSLVQITELAPCQTPPGWGWCPAAECQAATSPVPRSRHSAVMKARWSAGATQTGSSWPPQSPAAFYPDPSAHVTNTYHRITPSDPSAHINNTYHRLATSDPSAHVTNTYHRLTTSDPSAHVTNTYHRLTTSDPSAHVTNTYHKITLQSPEAFYPDPSAHITNTYHRIILSDPSAHVTNTYHRMTQQLPIACSILPWPICPRYQHIL